MDQSMWFWDEAVNHRILPEARVSVGPAAG